MIIISLYLFLIFLLLSRKHCCYPPGPKGLPIIGNMSMVAQLTHRGLAQLAKQYGGLMHLRMGLHDMVVVSTPDMAREVLQGQDSVFANRSSSFVATYLSYNRADMSFANYGPFWRQMRKICVMKLFSRKRVETWDSVGDEINKMVQAVATKTGSPTDLSKVASSLTSHITYKAAFGTNSREGEEGQFETILQEFSKLFAEFNVADFIPWLSWIYTKDLKRRLVNVRGALDVFIDKLIDEHLAKKSNKNSKDENEAAATDMVDELVSFLDEGADHENIKSTDSLSTFKLNRDNIKGLIMDIMIGGTETVASVIEWAMTELMKNPEELKKVQEELSNVVGLCRRVQDSDLENLTYLKCTLKETLRLHPPIPLVFHETAKDTMLAGYLIPARWSVVINTWAIGRDKTAWDEPNAFKPSRFLEPGAKDFKGNDFEFIPFGSGRRSCPGMQLGFYVLEKCVAELVHCFTWELHGGMKGSEIDMSDNFGLTTPKAIPLVVVPSYRLECAL
ncbi:cytochrome P450 84A1-like isoform X2 [Quercus lobata]|uniref:cytochrome P450 84A1-like isoform X2 n=1 Tax=Quercus lobata TaxID=97700 RepID=UPI001246C2B2|nr:cytochrome P450 84A1-like isoform X2 [Quercus lobata]